MILTFIEILGRVRDVCEDRVQAYTRNTLSLDEMCFGKREFLLLQPVPTSSLWKMLPSSFSFSPFFTRETVGIIASGMEWDAGEGAPPAPCLGGRLSWAPGEQSTPCSAQGDATAQSCSRCTSPQPAGCDLWAGWMWLHSEPGKINVKQWGSMVRSQLWGIHSS